MNMTSKKSIIWTSGLALSMALAIGCGSEDEGPVDDEPSLENATDYPEVPVSDACGGKCDDPDAALQSSSARIVANLEMMSYESSEGVEEDFILMAEALEESFEILEEGDVLKVEIYAADGAANPDFKVEGELQYRVVDEELLIGSFVSERIDTSELLPWQLLKIDVIGQLGETDVLQTFEFAPGLMQGAEILPEPEDPFAPALDVHAGAIFIDPAVPAPEYVYPRTDGFTLSGTEFWQRWEGGHSPTFSYSAGTELGRKCMYASALRFEAIMDEAPESIVALKDQTNWSGRFFNWNDDYSHEEAQGRPRGAALWAWRTGLIKWISQTGADGTCYLPTLGAVQSAAANCSSRALRDDGEIEGCQGY